jgi:hypothetical protein
MTATIVNASSDSCSNILTNHHFGSLFTSPQWIEAVSRTYGLNLQASVSVRKNHQAAILFSHICDFRGERVVSLPFSDYCDPLVDDPDTWKELIEPLIAFNSPIRLRVLRNDLPGNYECFTLCKVAKWHGIDLGRNEDELWAGLSPQARQNIGHARRSGLVVREGRGIEDVQVMHKMHCHTRKTKYRLLAQPLAFFENLYDMFRPDDGVTVLIAELSGTPLAALFLLQWRNILYYKFNASLDQGYRPNDLLIWQAMLLGRERGLAALDFGLSDLEQPGLVRFKRKYATEEQTIHYFEWRPQRPPDTCSEQSAEILHQIVRLLTDPSVPDEITRLAGEKFYRFFA